MRRVFHVAAQAAYWRQRPEDVIRAAVDGTRHVVDACLRAGVQRLVLTSSLAALGVPLGDELLTEAHVFNLSPDRFPYGYAKRQAEIEAVQRAGADLQVVIVNPSIVLGAGDVHQISGSLIVQAARGRTFLYTGGGTNIVHIDDVAAGHLAAAERGRHGERYILGGENLTHRELFTLLAEIVGGTRMVIEGVSTTKAAHTLAQMHGVEMPLTHELYRVLFEDKPVSDVLPSLLARALRSEGEYPEIGRQRS